MLKKQLLLSTLLLIALVTTSFAQKRILALTIDDLPFVGDSKNFHLNMIIEAIKEQEIPATGFVIGREVTPQNLPVLRKFHDAGLGLGNHTLSHANLNKMGPDAYIRDIDAADKILSTVLTEPKYFRYPYLVMGDGAKKTKVMEYLDAKHYQIAPISIDSKDFMFNQLLLSVPERERRQFLSVLKPCYLNFIWQQTLKAEENTRSARKDDQAQILLIHANLLNAYALPDIIALFKEKGFSFISLEDALKTMAQYKRSASAHSTKSLASVDHFMAWD